MVRGDFPIRFTEDTGLFGLDFKIIMSRSRHACAATSRGTGLKGSCPGGSREAGGVRRVGPSHPRRAMHSVAGCARVS